MKKLACMSLVALLACGGGGGGGDDDDDDGGDVDAPAGVRWPTGAVLTEPDGGVTTFAVSFDDRGRLISEASTDGLIVRTWTYEGDFLRELVETRAGGLYEQYQVTDFTGGLPRVVQHRQPVPNGTFIMSEVTWDWDPAASPPSLRTRTSRRSNSSVPTVETFTDGSNRFTIEICQGSTCARDVYHGPYDYLGGPSWWTELRRNAELRQSRTFDANQQLLTHDTLDPLDDFWSTRRAWTRTPEGAPLTFTSTRAGETTSIEYTFD
jgi:YD repeat-containing protein